MTPEKGRPKEIGNRPEKELRCYDLLDRLQIPYWRLDHEPADTMEICADINRKLGAVICKNLFLSNRQETEFYLLLMPGDKPFRTRHLSARLGVSRLSFGKEHFMAELLDNTPGSASVLGLMNDTGNRVQLVIDRDVLREAYLGCHPCINTSSLRLRTEDVVQILLPALHHEPVLVELPREQEEPCTDR